ncbi:F/Y-rich N-terminus-domain-containing protein [Blakeslea trispora]|nr:F/Y-rich N-terminus-domain-containing protein [Blakeslea trispora]
MVKKGVEKACQTETWDDARLVKYRKMKRRLIEFMAKQKEAQAALNKANRKIQLLLERKNSQKQKSVSNDPMETSDMEQEPTEHQDEEDEEISEEEEEDELDEDDEKDIPPPRKVRSRRRKHMAVPRGKDGRITLPCQIASLKVISLGQVDYRRPNFHNERYIFPIGYTAERTYMSFVDPNSQTSYTCKVEDGGDGPLFTIQAADCPDEKLSARTATRVWGFVLRKANEVRHKETSNAISGPEYYGFSHPLVIEMIEELDGVDKCDRYIRRPRE